MTADPMGIIDFISLYAIAIAEENASGAKVVTAPTNGACAVIPAVMLYLKNHTIGFSDEKAIEFLLTAMLIGSFIRKMQVLAEQKQVVKQKLVVLVRWQLRLWQQF